jgi:hypothetical protein
MTRRKLSAVPILVVVLALLAAGAASAAILQKGSQVLNLVSPATNTGSYAFTELYVRKPDGSIAPFVLPDNTVLIISGITWGFYPTDPSLNGRVQLNLGEYYRMGAQVANGSGGSTDYIAPGVAATNMDALIWVEKAGDPDRKPIPGQLSLRMECFTAPND